MGASCRILSLLAVAAASCVASPGTQGPGARADRRYDPMGESTLGTRPFVDAFAIPAVWLRRDEDGGEVVDPDVLRGFGYGARAALGRGERTIGLCYMGFHTEEEADELQAHALFFDGDVRAALPEAPDTFFFRVAFGIGGAMMDASYDDDLRAEAAAQLRLGIDYRPLDRFLLNAGAGGIVFGHPGETEVYGTFLTLGATLIF